MTAGEQLWALITRYRAADVPRLWTHGQRQDPEAIAVELWGLPLDAVLNCSAADLVPDWRDDAARVQERRLAWRRRGLAGLTRQCAHCGRPFWGLLRAQCCSEPCRCAHWYARQHDNETATLGKGE